MLNVNYIQFVAALRSDPHSCFPLARSVFSDFPVSSICSLLSGTPVVRYLAHHRFELVDAPQNKYIVHRNCIKFTITIFMLTNTQRQSLFNSNRFDLCVQPPARIFHLLLDVVFFLVFFFSVHSPPAQAVQCSSAGWRATCKKHTTFTHAFDECAACFAFFVCAGISLPQRSHSLGMALFSLARNYILLMVNIVRACCFGFVFI